MAEQNLPVDEKPKQAADVLTELLVVNKEMAKELKFLKNYFRLQAIWNGFKWAILVLVIIFGIVSLRAVTGYLQSYVDVLKTYSSPLEKSNQ